jgi:hypothetical protein
MYVGMYFHLVVYSRMYYYYTYYIQYMYMTHVCIIHSNTAFEAQLAPLALGRVGNGMHVLILVAAVLLLPGELSVI